MIGSLADVRGDARLNLEVIGRLGLSIVEIVDAQAWELHGSQVTAAEVIVDAIVGTGLNRALTGLHETVVADVNAGEATVIAVDLPSGLSADTAELIGPVLEADVTVTLAAPKVPLVLPPAEHIAGDVVIADIGIPLGVRGRGGRAAARPADPRVGAGADPARAPPTPTRATLGRVLIVAGSRGKTGAAVLARAGRCAAGAGLVTVATPASGQPIVASQGVEFMTAPLAETAEGTCDGAAVDQILALDADVVAIGPGLGTGPAVTGVVRELLERCEQPLVVDADALNACAGDAGVLRGREGRPVVITPHPGEMARLLGCSAADVQANRVGLATELATTHQIYVVLKGYRTVIATPAGAVYVNPTGSPGMATGGTGDVLTGMIAAWIGQLLDPEAACRIAVYVHGAAGELSDADEGEVAMTAGDLVAHVGEALLELTARRRVAAPVGVTRVLRLGVRGRDPGHRQDGGGVARRR